MKGDIFQPVVEVSSGVVWKPLPRVVAYEATIPLIYQMKWTKYSYQPSITIMDKKCINKQTTDCQIEMEMQKLSNAYEMDLKRIERNFEINLQNKRIFHGRRRRALDFLGGALEFCCGVATLKTIDGMTMNEKELEDHVEKLTQGLTSTIQRIGMDSKAFKQYEEEVTNTFQTIEKRSNYVETEIQKAQEEIKDQGNVITRLYSHTYSNLRRLISLTRVMKTNAILASCKLNQIPSNILEMETLQHDLDQLDQELRESNQGLAIPTADITRYYQLPICDCTFTSSKISLHLKIPIIANHQSWKLYELLTTAFAWYNQTCTLSHNTLYLAVSDSKNKKALIRTVTGVALHQCRVYEDKLCYIPHLSTNGLHGPLCAIKMFRGDTVENLGKYCPMTCHQSTAMLIVELEEENYLITHPDPNSQIICSQTSHLLIKETPPKIGSLRLYLPCSCKLILSEDILIPNRYPCQENDPPEIKIIHTIPATWSTLKSFIIQPNSKNYPTYKNFTECVNHNWTLQVPHLNLTSTPEEMDNIIKYINHHEEPRLTFHDEYGYLSHSTFLIWNIILTIVIVYLVYKSRTPVAIVAATPGIQAREENVNDSHHTLLMTITLVIFGILMAILIWWILNQIKHYYKKRRTERKGKINHTKEDHNGEEAASEMGSTYVLSVKSFEDIAALKDGKDISAALKIRVENQQT